MFAARLQLGEISRWWPHTHGDQPLYDVDVEIDGVVKHAGRVGFRTRGYRPLPTVDSQFRSTERRVPQGGGLDATLSGCPCRRVLPRSGGWSSWPEQPISNLIRAPGTGVYQDDTFWDACDELGILVWHECMLSFYDPPDDPDSSLSLQRNWANSSTSSRAGFPALVCGSQEIEEQATMNSVARSKWNFPVLDEVIPDLVADALPGIPYVTSNPTGGVVPYQMDSGVSQYFGIGGYLQPFEDARRARCPFAAECLAFATPPERRTIEEECGGAYRAGHDPTWKRAVHHDAGRSWDMEDMQSDYTRKVFGIDPFEVRYHDAERALDLAAPPSWSSSRTC